MLLRIGVGVTEQWVEDAIPILQDAGFQLVAQAFAPESDGEYVYCDFDYGTATPMSMRAFTRLITQVRNVVAASLIPHLTCTWISASDKIKPT